MHLCFLICLRLPAVVALYSLANALPVYREDVIDGDALEELLLIVDDFQSEILLNAAIGCWMLFVVEAILLLAR